MARPITERLLGEHIVMLANDGDAQLRELRTQVVVYEVPAGKRALVKDVRITPMIKNPNDDFEDVVWPVTNVNDNDLILTLEKSPLVISESSSPDPNPKAIYMGNFSGAVLPSFVLEPGERLIFSWQWTTATDQTFEVFALARIHGVEVDI